MLFEFSKTIEEAFNTAADKARAMNTEFVSKEIMLLCVLEHKTVKPTIVKHIPNYVIQRDELLDFIGQSIVVLNRTINSVLFNRDMEALLEQAVHCRFMRQQDRIIDTPQLLLTMYNDKLSFAGDWLRRHVCIPRGYQFANVLYEIAANPNAKFPTSTKVRKSCPPLCSYILPEIADGWHLVGREKEIERALTVLCRRNKSTPVFIGEHGVGKSAIVRGLAERINKGNVPERLKGKRVLQFDLSAAIAGTPYRGDLEKKLKEVLDGVVGPGDIILYIDNIHALVGAGRLTETTIDSVSLLAPYIESGRLSVIGTSTFGEYRVACNRNRNISSLFQTIDVADQDKEESAKVLALHKNQLEVYHHVTYTEDAIEYAVNASERYLPGKSLPGKAIELLDEAGAAMEIKDIRRVDRVAVRDSLSLISGIDLSEGDNMDGDVRFLKERLLDKIYGQNGAIETVCRAIYSSKAGLSDSLKPIASLLFVGPTGVGKTQLAKELAAFMHVPLERIDMSEYGEKHSASKLIGTTAGYIGYEDGGILTDAIKKNPYCVLLLDEIEKAHPDVFNLLLQIMDYGTLTDGMGIKVNFRNVVLIMTSNTGARYAHRASIGFTPTVNAGAAMSKEVRNTFTPEFINRLTEIVVFNDMDKEMARLILGAKLRELDGKLESKNIHLEYTDEAKIEMLRLGYSPEYGAREMERVIGNQIKPLIVNEILFGSLASGGSAVLDFIDGRFTVSVLQNDVRFSLGERLKTLFTRPSA